MYQTLSQNSNPHVISHNPAVDIQDSSNKKSNWSACLFNARSIVNKLNNFQSYIWILILWSSRKPGLLTQFLTMKSYLWTLPFIVKTVAPEEVVSCLQ